MALPSTINSASPAGSDSPALGDDQIRALKLAIEDIFAIPDATAIAAAGFTFAAAGMTVIVLQDGAANPTAAGEIRRNSRKLMLHDGVAARALSSIASADVTSVGNVGGGEDTLMTYTLGANTLNADGRGVRVTVGGSFAANANTKTIKFHFGATALTMNPVATAPNNLAWSGTFEVVRTGASAERITGTVIVGTQWNLTTSTTAAADTTAAITIKCTGESASSATNDVLQNVMLIEVLN